MKEQFTTTGQAAQQIGYDPEHIRRLARNGKIKSRKWGRDWMIDVSSLLEYRKNEGRRPKMKKET